MNSIQIDKILSSADLKTKKCYKGTFASNTIQKFKTYPYAIVVNTDRQGTPGTHWVGMFFTKPDTIEYFDSFGIWPPNSFDLHKYVGSFKFIKVNKIKLQHSLDISCGPYVIYFLVNRCNGVPFDTIVKSLSASSPYADTIVKMFVYHIAALNK